MRGGRVNDEQNTNNKIAEGEKKRAMLEVKIYCNIME